MADNERTMASTPAHRARQQDALHQQIIDLVPALPFDDDPSTFVRVLRELAAAHALDDEA
jgi:hypothetical protein